MDIGDADGPTGTMEVDGDMVAMDTYDEDSTEGQRAWRGENSDMTSESKEMLDLPVVPEPFGMVSHQLPCGVQERQWRLPEGVCRKKVLQSGEGLHSPQPGSCCSVTLHAPQGSDVDVCQVGYSLGQSTLQIGDGGTPLSCLIDAALLSMKPGETAELHISRLKNTSTEFLFQVTLHNFTTARPPWRMTAVEKCTAAAAHKEKGAQLYKDGNIFAAFTQFRTAIRLLLSVLPVSFLEDEADDRSRRQLLCQCYLNLAACQMKSGHHQHVVTNCTQALSIDPSSVKALYRRASANASLGNYLLAEDDLKMGLCKEPNNRVLLDLIQTVNAKLASSQTDMSRGLSKMFS